MKKLAVLPLIVLLLLALPVSAHSSNMNGFTYSVIGGKVTITGFSGEPESVAIPEYIEKCPVVGVRDNAFYRCTSLKSVTLPATVKDIGHHAFFGCTSLENAVLPQGLENVGMGCFEECTSLKEVSLPDSLSVLPDSCFRGCTSLGTAVIPQSVTVIEKFCFCGCTSLNYVSLSGRLRTVGVGSFYMCGAMKNIYIPPSVTLIGGEAFGYEQGEKKSPLTILGCSGSAAEEYASANAIEFDDVPEAAAAFDPASSENAPVKLPVPLAVSGGLLFLLTALLALRQYLRSRR